MGRILFPRGKQSEFISKILKDNKLTIGDLAKIVGVSSRTIRDWRREKFTIAENSFLQLTKHFHVIIPTHIKRIDNYWYVVKGARKGALKRLKIYGPPGTQEGRIKGGKKSQLRRKLYPELYAKCIVRKNFLEPKRSEKLAELIGIILGDGGITNYQLKITLNKETESGYIHFVSKILEGMFNEKPRKYFSEAYRKEKVCNLTINGINLINILQKLGLQKGNKIILQVAVPSWIIRNKDYSKSCLRGLIDTDGGLYFHKHKIHGFYCFNLGLTYTSYSKPLLEFAYQTLIKFGFSPKLAKRSLYLYKYNEINRYFDIIGFHNSHHLKRLSEFKKLKMYKRRSTQVVDEARLESV